MSTNGIPEEILINDKELSLSLQRLLHAPTKNSPFTKQEVGDGVGVNEEEVVLTSDGSKDYFAEEEFKAIEATLLWKNQKRAKAIVNEWTNKGLISETQKTELDICVSNCQPLKKPISISTVWGQEKLVFQPAEGSFARPENMIFQISPYVLIFPSFAKYANENYPKCKEKDKTGDTLINDKSWEDELRRAITNILSELFGGEEAKYLLSKGDRFLMTSAVCELFSYLLSCSNWIGENSEIQKHIPCDELINKIDHNTATNIYLLLSDAFDSVGDKKAFERNHANEITQENTENQYLQFQKKQRQCLKAFANKTGCSIVISRQVVQKTSPLVQSLLKGIENSPGTLGSRWRSLSQKNRSYVEQVTELSFRRKMRELMEVARAEIDELFSGQ